jgi:tetratricopeptide (TPR) repeat protein
MTEARNGPKKFALICLVLALGTMALYWPVTRHQFILFDDEQYVTANPHVTTGLSRANFVWAFQNTEAANWHPLTWLSHQLDCTLFGQNAGAHHFVSLLFHVTNTLLVFAFLRGTTGALWRSAFVAAFFAWHPLHVESVAWASERKDVLSTFFFLLTLISYACFTNWSKVQSPKSKIFYLLALGCFALGLMSKPMVVTLPFVLLLLDFWPLQRFSLSNLHRPILSRLLVEKIPFFALAFAGCVVTYLVQKSNGAVSPVSTASHVENVLLTYVRYLSKTFWPAGLSIIYPYRYSWPMVFVLGTATLLVIWSALLICRAKKNPPLAVGWLWFLGTLVPTIGVVQVGAQSMADRYMYIPSIGLFIVVVWGANDLINRWPEKGKFLPLAGAVALVGCLGVTSIQISYWRDSVTIFLHAIEVTTDNYVAENCLGKAFDQSGRPDRALALYVDAVKIEPRYPQSQFNLALCLSAFGRTNEALEHLQIAARLEQQDPDIQYALGTYFSQFGSLADATHAFQAALADRPDFPEAQTAFGTLLSRQKKFAEAIPHFAATVRLKPSDPDARFNLGLALLDNHQPAEAAEQFAAELRLVPDETRAHFRLAQALQQENKFAEAVTHYRATLRLTPNFPEAEAALDQIFAAHPELKSPP